jgi:hypothetical protein
MLNISAKSEQLSPLCLKGLTHFCAAAGLYDSETLNKYNLDWPKVHTVHKLIYTYVLVHVRILGG